MFKKLFGNKPEPQPVLEDICEHPELVTIVGHPELDILFIDPTADTILNALEGWKWMDLRGLKPISVSAFGDVFFVDQNSAIIRLDWIDGILSEVAPSLAAFEELLQTEAARAELLLAGFVIMARERGLVLEPGECYDFEIMPILGGKIETDNLEKLSFLVKLYMAGQIHQQVKDLPPGTPINSIKFVD
jgi:hypothetical protein